MITSHDIIALARGYVGVRFAHQGRGRDGVDCLGLLIAVADECGLEFDGKPSSALDVPQYGSRPDVVALKQKLDAHLTPITRADVRPADIVVLKIDGSPQHLALITDYPMAEEMGMIHAYAPARKVVEHRYDKDWRHATYGAYRLPQLY